MANLNFDTGLVVLNVQGDPFRKFKFNPTDPKLLAGFLDLIDETDKKVKEFAEKAGDIEPDKLDETEFTRKTAKLMNEIDIWFRDEFDKVFGAGQSNTVFGEVSTAAINNDGDYIMIAMLMALYPHFEKAIEDRTKGMEAAYREIIEDIPAASEEVETKETKVIGFTSGEQGE